MSGGTGGVPPYGTPPPYGPGSPGHGAPPPQPSGPAPSHPPYGSPPLYGTQPPHPAAPPPYGMPQSQPAAPPPYGTASAVPRPPRGPGCAVVTGFFVLRVCGTAAAAPCAQCGRPVCAAHLHPGGLCSECAAALDAAADHPMHPLWPQRHRRRTYRRVSDEYHDLTWYSTFDAVDRASFTHHHHHHGDHDDPFGGFDADGDGDVDDDDLDYGTDS